MQSVSTQFNDRAQGSIRPLSWRLLMSFDKTFLPTVDFFTIGTSTIGGGDIIKGGGDVIQEWDKYQYVDYTNRVMSLEWSRSTDPIFSVSLAMADVVLNNHDGLFTPNGGSEIEDYILPYRPIKIYSGFQSEDVQVFVGLTEKMPEVDEKEKTVTFHCIDFLYSLFNRPLDESVIYQNMRTDEVLDELFQLVGLLPTQYDLDTGYNVMNFVYFTKGTKLGDAISKLMEAEQGRVYMDESGVIKFINRQHFDNTSVYSFTPNNVVDIQTSKQDDIVNSVEIKSDIREVQPIQKYWELAEPVLVPANGDVVIWADFIDPVTSCDEPEYISTATTSSYETNVNEDGSGSTNDTAISLTDFFLFAQSYRMEFTNSSGTATYVTSVILFVEPAKVTTKVYVREDDSDSIEKYNERPLVIDNDFIQGETEAQSKALLILQDFSQYGLTKSMKVKGNMALQLDDAINLTLPSQGTNLQSITKISCRVADGNFTQFLTIKEKDPVIYFTIGVSYIGLTDVIAP